jgi:SAM-dependent methyltransferase
MLNFVRTIKPRQRLLQVMFAMLYGPGVALHESVGGLVFGAAWSGRRQWVAEQANASAGILLDVGCGDGRLLERLASDGICCFGLDRSRAMVRRAAKRHHGVFQAAAQAIPCGDAVVSSIVVTYPGPWIFDSATWQEFARVMLPSASVMILLGGSIERGRGSRIRRLLTRITYGARHQRTEREPMPLLGNAFISGSLCEVEDEWGSISVWRGRRTQDPFPERLEGPSSS